MNNINYHYEQVVSFLPTQEMREEAESALLREKSFNLLLWSLFERCAPIPGQEEIIVSGYVMGDGKGDWLNILNTCKHLRKKFPDRNIRVIAGAASKHRDSLLQDKVEDCHILFKGDGIEAPSFSFDHFEEGSELIEKVAQAAAILIGPIELPGLYHSFSRKMQDKGIAIQEYDVQTNFDELCEQQLRMGLDPVEGIGIFTRHLKSYSWKDLENLRLRKLLFTDPFSFDPEEYLSTHQFFLCYMGEKSASRFIQQCLEFAFERDPLKHVDICYPCKDSPKNFFMEMKKVDWNRLKVGSLSFYDGSGDELCVENVELGAPGRMVRILNVGPLLQRDFRILTRISAPLVGCTGDNSLALALSYGKIPFYEATGHKMALASHLKRIIQKNFGFRSPLFRLISERSFPQLQSEQLIREAEALGEIIRTQFSVNGRIQGAVNERILYSQDEGYAEWVDELQLQYLSEEISIETVAQELEIELIEKGLL